MKLSTITTSIQSRIDGMGDFKRVYLGDEDNIGDAPVVTVVPDDRSRELYATGQRTLNTYRIIVTILYAKYGDPRANRLESLLLAEKVEDRLNEDVTLDGNVIHGFVTRVEPGFSNRRNSLYVATQLTWEGTSRTGLVE